MRRVRVLIADPDEHLLAGYRRVIGETFELVTARNGLESIRCLREFPPDVFVLEPRLPWGGGDGVLALMHEVQALAFVPVMIVTACRDRAVLESVAAYRISDYRVKPLAPVQLAKRIRHVLDRCSRHGTADEDFDRPKPWSEQRTGTAAVRNGVRAD